MPNGKFKKTPPEKREAAVPASVLEEEYIKFNTNTTSNHVDLTSNSAKNAAPSPFGVPSVRSSDRDLQLIVKSFGSELTDEERVEIDTLVEADRLCRICPDPDVVRWPGDLTVQQRTDRTTFARIMLCDYYEKDGPVHRVVKAATHLEYDMVPPGPNIPQDEIDEWNEQRRAYATRIVPPELGIARIVGETRRLIENAYFRAGGEPGDVRSLYPGTPELVSFLNACLFGGTVVSYVEQGANGAEKTKAMRIDFGCMPLYKRDFSKSLRAQVPVELMMQVYAECELWRAEADGEPYRYVLDGSGGQGFLAQRDHGPDGPYRRIKEPEGRDSAGEEVMVMVSRYADGVGQQAAVAFYLTLCRLAPHCDMKDTDPALVPLGSGYIFDPRTKLARPMTDGDVFVGCLAGLTWEVNDDGTVEPIQKPLFCEDGEVVFDEAEADIHGGVALDPECYFKEIQPTEDGQNALCDITQATATPRMPRDKAPLLVGAPRAGKGTTLQLLRNAFGDKVQQARTTTTMNMAQFADRTFNVAARGKLLVYSDEESTGGYIDDCAPFKAFVSHDPYATRDLFGHKTEVTSVGMFIGCMNDFVGFSDKGRAMLGRLFVVPFRISHLGNEDRRIKGWMADPRTVNWWFYHVLVELPFQSELRENNLTRAAKGEYQLTIDPVRQFFEEEVKPKVGDFTPNALLYTMFTVWYKRVNGSGRVLSMKKFISALEDIVADDEDFELPRERNKSDGSCGGFVRLEASKVFDCAQAASHLHDPTMYCTPRVGYKGAITWEPHELDAWCDESIVENRGRVRGWLVRAGAWHDYESGISPLKKRAMESEKRARVIREKAENHARAQANKAKADAAKKRAAQAKPFDTDGYYSWFLDSVEIACDEFGGYLLESDDGMLRRDPLSREEWSARYCPFVLENDAHISCINHSSFYSDLNGRKPVNCDAAYNRYRICAQACLDRDGAYALGGSVNKLGNEGQGDNSATVFTRALDRYTWSALGSAIERVRRVQTEDGGFVWLLGPAQPHSFNERPVLDKSKNAYRRYHILAERALAEAGGYAVRGAKASVPVVLQEVIGESLWMSLSSPSIHVGDADVDGRVWPVLEPALEPADFPYMAHRKSFEQSYMSAEGIVSALSIEPEHQPNEMDTLDKRYERFREAAKTAIDEVGGYVVREGGSRGATLWSEIIGRDKWEAYGHPTERAVECVTLDGTVWPLIE